MMPIAQNIQALARALEGADPRLPFIVFKIVQERLKGRIVKMEADSLAALTALDNPNVRVNPAEAALLLPELRRFFTSDGAPRAVFFGEAAERV